MKDCVKRVPRFVHTATERCSCAPLSCMQAEQDRIEREAAAATVLGRLVNESSPGCHLDAITRLAQNGPPPLRGAAALSLAALLPSVGAEAAGHINTLARLLSSDRQDGHLSGEALRAATHVVCSCDVFEGTPALLAALIAALQRTLACGTTCMASPSTDEGAHNGDTEQVAREQASTGLRAADCQRLAVDFTCSHERVSVTFSTTTEGLIAAREGLAAKVAVSSIAALLDVPARRLRSAAACAVRLFSSAAIKVDALVPLMRAAVLCRVRVVLPAYMP